MLVPPAQHLVNSPPSCTLLLPVQLACNTRTPARACQYTAVTCAACLSACCCRFSMHTTAPRVPSIMGGSGTCWLSAVCAFEQVPGEEPGSSNRWSVMVHYDTTTGQLLTHYHTWEAGIHPQPQQLQQVFSPGAHTQLMQEQHNRHTSIR
jgi:hypothetical protein